MKRRPHWDDALIESLPIPGHSYLEDEDIYAIIAAVEDWQDANGFSRAGTLMHRLIDAEAAIARVRELHTRTAETTYCAGCGRMWPCPTIRMIEEEL